MTHPAVQFVLDTIKDNWSAGSYSDIPLERVDGDNNQQLDADIRKTTQELKADNYVEAAYVGKTAEPIGTEYDLDIDAVVRVRVAGLHYLEHGYINPDNSLPPSTAGDPVPFNDVDGLVGAIKDALYTDRTFPSVASDWDEKSLIINNEPGPLSYEYGDYYRYEFDVLVDGFEDI
jgi:hypothetical protein